VIRAAANGDRTSASGIRPSSSEIRVDRGGPKAAAVAPVDHVMLGAMLDLEALRPERVRPLRRVEYDRLVEAGVFGDERVELLRGVLVEMSPQGESHGWLVAKLNQWLVEQLFQLGLNARYIVRPQLPYAASDDSEPEPDLAVVAQPASGDPHPERAYLLIEVAASSLRKDRKIKSSIYAEAGVPEYWIVDVDGRAVEIFTDPEAGAYRSIVRITSGELRPIALPGIAIRFDEILPR
jgi:Uma2 family endonuclease